MIRFQKVDESIAIVGTQREMFNRYAIMFILPSCMVYNADITRRYEFNPITVP